MEIALGRMKNYLCIDIGGTKIKYGVVDENAVIQYMKEVDTQAQLGGEVLMERVCGLIAEELETGGKMEGIGVSTAGMVDCRKGVVSYASEFIPGYTGMPIKARLEECFGLPCQVENDVNCAGLAESLAGAGRGSSVSLCLTVGTGIGGALIIDGKVFHGFCSSAGEIGYMYMAGTSASQGEEAPAGLSFQELGSAKALVRRVEERKKISPGVIDGRWVFDQAEKGDGDCIWAIRQMADVLGCGVANLCFMFNPQTVVLGGGIMERGKYLYPLLRERLDQYLLPFIASRTKLAMAQLGNRAGMLGAYYHFIGREREVQASGRI